MPDEFDDIFDEIKKLFKLDSEIFDVDFLFIPESEKDLELKPQNKKIKGFKISYHFESGMEKPEIRIEGNIDDNKIRDYLKNVDLSKHPTLEKLINSKAITEIDASQLSLEFSEQNNNLSILEPFTEINNYKDYTEIVLDIPGMSEENVIIDIGEEGTSLLFNAENKVRRYTKNVNLPFKSSANDYEVEVKNGIAVIKVKRSDE